MDNAERSKPHRRVEKWMLEMGIAFISEFPDFKPYQLDIYIPEWHLAIEVDGPYHLRKHDKVRDQWMREWYGVETLRIKAQLVKHKAVKAITEFLELHADTTETRKQKWLTLLSNA